MTNTGKGALGTLAAIGFVLLSFWGDFVDCNRSHERYSDRGVDLETLPQYVAEADELGLLDAPESPWGPPREGSQRTHWIELGADSIDASEFAPPDDLLADASEDITILVPTSFEELQTQVEDAGSVVVVAAEYDEAGRAAVALTIGGECSRPGRHCIVAVGSPGRLPHVTHSVRRAAEAGAHGLLERLQLGAKNDEGMFLYRVIPETTPMRLAEFRP